jgi:hypothetical protein
MAGIRVIAVTVNKDRFTAKYVPSRSLCHRGISFYRLQFTVMFYFNCETLCVPKIRFCNIGGEGQRELGVT